MTPAKLSQYLTENGIHADVAAYLSTISSWDEYDASKVVWGVTAGNREEFVTALSWALSANIGGLIALLPALAKDSFPDFGIAAPGCLRGYQDVSVKRKSWQLI